MIKASILLCALFVAYTSKAQEKGLAIDTTNYYEYYSKGSGLKGTKLSTCWLNSTDVIPIIMQELSAAGYEELYNNQLYQIGKQMIVLAAYSRIEDFGFVYSGSHEIIPQKEHRQRRSASAELSGNDYIQRCFQFKSEPISFLIKKLPTNIFILQEDVYWYQFTDNLLDNDVLVTKNAIINILRQDIRARIKHAPRPR